MTSRDAITRTSAYITLLTPLLVAPIFLGLFVVFPAILMELAITIYKLYEKIFAGDSIPHLMVHILDCIEICLGASLVYIMLYSSIQNFVCKLEIQARYRPTWMKHISISEIKMKIMTTLITIASLDLVNHTIDNENIAIKATLGRIIALIALAGIAYFLAKIEHLEQKIEEYQNKDKETSEH